MITLGGSSGRRGEGGPRCSLTTIRLGKRKSSRLSLCTSRKVGRHTTVCTEGKVSSESQPLERNEGGCRAQITCWQTCTDGLSMEALLKRLVSQRLGAGAESRANSRGHYATRLSIVVLVPASFAIGMPKTRRDEKHNAGNPGKKKARSPIQRARAFWKTELDRHLRDWAATTKPSLVESSRL